MLIFSMGKNRLDYHIKHRLKFRETAADKLTIWAGSWTFIIGLLVIIVIWMALNLYLLNKTFDPYPFILLNFVLSTLAALQAPIILMTQNRQSDRDRQNARYDYQVNRKTEREVQEIIRKLDEIKKKMK